jgi:threonine synthase
MEALRWVTGKRPRLYAVRGSASGADEDEEEMLASMLRWAKEEGILLSPGGAAGAAMYERLLLDGELKAGDTTVLVNPEAGLRYADEIAAAMKLRRRTALPVSAKVGGIITPV